LRAPDAGELLFEGGRVRTAAGNAVICAWSEGVRHGAKKSGCHGGVSAPEVVAPEPAVDWIVALQATPVYAAQKALAARVAPSYADLRSLLEALAARGGKLSKAALAQRLGMPAMRISGFVNAAKRVLNVDQAAVLDETAATVELNRELLARQFRVTVR
jgi:hypothetical protein